MKFLYFIAIVLFIALTGVICAPREREHITSGTTNYQTEDGSERHEKIEADGSLKGHYSYVDPDGKRVVVNYSAGKDGFKATGDHFAEFNLGESHLENKERDDDSTGAEDSHSRPSYHVQKTVPSYNTHKQISSYTPSQEHPSQTYNTQQEISKYIQAHAESPVIRREPQRPKSRPAVHYRPEPVQQYKPEIHESFETLANFHNAQNQQSVSYINQEKEEDNENVDDDDEEEEDHSYDAQSYNPYRPSNTKQYFTTKAPKRQPTFKPYYHAEEPAIENNPITTKFIIKHPASPVRNVESYSNPENQQKFSSNPKEYPEIKTKITYSEDTQNDKPSFESDDNLANFDVTKFLNDYHNNKPSTSQAAHVPTTKFTIEDVSAPSQGQTYSSKPAKAPEYSFGDFKSDKAPEYTFSDFKSQKAPEYTFTELKSEKPSEYNFNNLKSEKTPEYTFTDFKSDKAPEYNFNDFKLEKTPEYTFNNDFKSEKTPEFNFNDYKSQNAPEYSLTKFNEFKPENFKQPDFSNFFKADTTYSVEDTPKGKPIEEDFLNDKNPSNLSQYQQFLKATEDEKIEQQYIREQLNFKPQSNKQQQKRPSYSRPSVNSHHPGRRPPKRPTTSAGLGTFRTTFKIPYGFNL